MNFGVPGYIAFWAITALAFGLFGYRAHRLIGYLSLGKKGEAISNIVFWLGTGYIIQTMLNTSALTSDRWFQFWAILIVVSGVSLVVRALYLAVMWPLSRRHLYTAPSATP